MESYVYETSAELYRDKPRQDALVPPAQNENGSSCLLGLGGDGGGGEGARKNQSCSGVSPPPHLTGSAEGLLNSTNKMYQVLWLPERPCPMSVPQTSTQNSFHFTTRRLALFLAHDFPSLLFLKQCNTRNKVLSCL